MKSSTKLLQSSPVAFGLVVMTVAMLDLWSKSEMIAWLTPARRTIEVTPFFNLRLGYNPGISFGLFPTESDLSRMLLIGFALLATLLVVWLGLRSRVWIERLSFALIAGGAVGNVIDRGGDGLVTDFLDFHAFGWHWPTFNLADVAIASGVLVLLAASLIGDRFAQPSQDQTR
ncbi:MULTISPECIES: signal peptidase II [Hyphomicrobiales]|uniref:signal peptidase II n=1 Tax=Xanthobacter autotrophicus TaxID=280 RepID=UPI00372A2D22